MQENSYKGLAELSAPDTYLPRLYRPTPITSIAQRLEHPQGVMVWGLGLFLPQHGSFLVLSSKLAAILAPQAASHQKLCNLLLCAPLKIYPGNGKKKNPTFPGFNCNRYFSPYLVQCCVWDLV